MPVKLSLTEVYALLASNLLTKVIWTQSSSIPAAFMIIGYFIDSGEHQFAPLFNYRESGPRFHQAHKIYFSERKKMLNATRLLE